MTVVFLWNYHKYSNSKAFSEIRKKDKYKFNQLCVHCLHIKENEERGGVELEGQEI